MKADTCICTYTYTRKAHRKEDVNADEGWIVNHRISCGHRVYEMSNVEEDAPRPIDLNQLVDGERRTLKRNIVIMVLKEEVAQNHEDRDFCNVGQPARRVHVLANLRGR